jgi:hypothetical protein
MDAQHHSSRPASTSTQSGTGLLNQLKLLFAALAAGGRVVPMGDNGRTLRLLSEYAACLRRQ